MYSDEMLKQQLNDQGLRFTPQRLKILKIFQSLPRGTHWSAEELHEELLAQAERISLSTVYRTLHIMTRMGILRELELAEEHKHYELNRSPSGQHHHLICVHCNRILEFAEAGVDKIGGKQADAMGYHVLDCQLNLYGVCPDCQNQRH
ncbi:MAG: transcriptional repressor [Cyanothece sp. SIO2G6]|nr:transcriptional repressor [Cyanothece sp. SIO2G6]